VFALRRDRRPCGRSSEPGSEREAVLEREFHTLEHLKWYEGLPASPAVRTGDLLFIAGQVALEDDFKVVAPGDVKAQARRALDSVRGLVEAAGGTLHDIVEVISFHKDPRDIWQVLDVAREYFQGDYPAWTAAGTIGLYSSDLLVSIQAIAHLGPETKECYTPDWLRWLSSYPISGGCKKGNLLFVSGQSAVDPDGAVLEFGDHIAQARHAYRGMLEIVGMAGGSVDDILDFTSFHQDIRGAEPTLMNVYIPEILGDIDFANAATTSHIGSPGLLKLGMLGTYRAVADLSPGKRVASTPDSIWWKHVYPIAGGARKPGGTLITIAGQVACAPDASVVTPGDTEGQARYIFECMKEILEEFGVPMGNVVQVTSFHKDPRAWQTVMKVGEDYFRADRGPAWTPVGTAGLWMEGYLHEIAALAVV
jgi:enamine deaminase RidA (YjgF/YER057c/UK114 family)